MKIDLLHEIYECGIFTETEFRKFAARLLFKCGKWSAIIEEFPLRYNSENFDSQKIFGDPSGKIDLFGFDLCLKKCSFLELKRIDDNDIYNGRYFGQLLNYKLIYDGSLPNEMFGRLLRKCQNSELHCHGEIEKTLQEIIEIGGDKEVSEVGDPLPEIAEIGLLICGGNIDDLESPKCDIIYSQFLEFSKICKFIGCNFSIYHLTIDDQGSRIIHITDLDKAGYFTGDD